MEIAQITGDGPPTERAGVGMAVIEFLPMLIERSVGVLGADAASLVLADGRGDLRVTASSDERAHALELFEAMTREGPGLDCYRGGEPVVNQALNGAGGRWPGIRRHAQAAGFVSSHAFPLRSGEHVIGTLNLFSIGNTTLGEREVAAGQAIADVATIGLVQTRALEQAWAFTGQLQGALNSRVVIEQAKGILAERATVDVDTAFGLLRTYARNHNAPLSEVARGVIEAALSAETITTPFRRGGTQQLPGRPPPPAA